MAKLRVRLGREAFLDVSGVCHFELNESIQGSIRGFVFEHRESVKVGERHRDDCR